MEKQKKIFEFVKLKEGYEPEVKIIKNNYFTSWGLIKEVIIRKTYKSQEIDKLI